MVHFIQQRHARLWYNREAMNKTTGTFDGTVIRSVCHGSQVVVRVPRILRTRYTKDFGPGFYCTVMRDQAVRWAVRFTERVIAALRFDAAEEVYDE